MKLQEISQIVKASQSLINEELEIESLAAMPNQASDKELALVFPTSFNKAQKLFRNSKAKVFLVSEKLFNDKNFSEYLENREEKLSLIVVARPKFALQLLMPHFSRTRFKPKAIHPSAVIEDSAKLDASVSVGALSYIAADVKIAAGTVIHPRVTIGQGVSIGENCEIRSGVVIEDYCELHDRVIIHPNSVIGADGYSYVTEEATNLEKMQNKDFNFSMDRQILHKIESAGTVVIADDVEIGANTCIDRGNIGATKIGLGTKIDNLCQIAHNVEIGKDCLIIAQTGIAGSAKISDRVTMAGSSGCGDGVEIGNDAVIAAFSAVNSNIDPFMPVVGIPAIAYGEFMRRQRALGKLSKHQEELRKVKSKLEELSKKS